MIYQHRPCGLIYDTPEALARHSTHCPQTSHSQKVESSKQHLQGNSRWGYVGAGIVLLNSHSQTPPMFKHVSRDFGLASCAGVLHSELSVTTCSAADVKHTAGNGTSHFYPQTSGFEGLYTIGRDSACPLRQWGQTQ